MAIHAGLTAEYREYFAGFLAQVSELDRQLAEIVLRLMWHEALTDQRINPQEGTVRWLRVLLRLLDRRSVSSTRVDRLLVQIETFAKQEMSPPPGVVAPDVAKHRVLFDVLECLEVIQVIRDREAPIDQFTWKYWIPGREFHRDLLALRVYLGNDDFNRLLTYMHASPAESHFSWWEELRLRTGLVWTI